ncbi:DUF572-domain-containing protein [Microthyrium microscopicum]|uniref:Splicing factor YJU2 n=1 Tax=Microthyrium microscopicum TaxID=703497 RepID=A0A6A6UNA8_9PEZI|nr:DUF572-domain-containing protein [Microthyrium microscopicum]
MSERKVLQKYYPPDFDHTKITKSKGPKSTKLPTVRLMTPFAMRCTRCGTWIPKSKKFNARKETPEGDKYLGIQKFRFYLRCPGCSGEISFMTDPKNMDYVAEAGAKRNFEPWRENHVEETDEERLRRLEAEEVEVDPMQDLEAKMHDAQEDMQVADALDEIRAANMRHLKAAEGGEVTVAPDAVDEERERQEADDAEAARLAFQKVGAAEPLEDLQSVQEVAEPAEVIPIITTSFKRTFKKKKDFGAALGLKKKTS